ncbi:lytic murein transglycosylase [Hyphomonas sp. NPDC076900]|uniref:lytic murein transglycosylase n=1 Tax=unclassified Hyphomonas TaxID=2630699 RepID=UPI003D019F33
MIITGLARSKWMGIAIVCGALASCAAGPQAPSPKPPVTGTPSPAPETGPIVYKSSGHAAMDAWRDDFSARAMAAGNDRALVKSLLENISPITMWLGTADTLQTQTAPSDQAEFAKPIWDYLATPLGNTRITQGQQKLASTRATLDAIEAAYGVDRSALLAIWGMETNFGGFIGRDDAANALANMAVEGRRRSLAESELYALMKILKDGDALRGDLIAGWAGAMGQTQFMPSTYVAHAVDFDGDGRKDVWKSEADALASAANYLARSGYMKGQPWGIEVLTPEGFDFSLADGSERRMATWVAAGLSPIRGGAFDTGGADFAEFWLPAGASGPKFLLFKNFNVFKTYNRADSYALAVGLSGDMIIGKGGPVAAWPKHLAPLTVVEIRDLQDGLNALGYDAGTADGIAGRRTKTALQNFQKARGFLADGYPTKEMLAAVRSGAPAIN